MEKKNKDLVDDNDGDIILNESGTSVSIDVTDAEKQSGSKEAKSDKAEEEKILKSNTGFAE